MSSHILQPGGEDKWSLLAGAVDEIDPKAFPRAKTNGHGSSLAHLLDDIVVLLNTYMTFQYAEQAHTCALWVVHAVAVDNFGESPKLFVTSPEPGCGKTELLKLLDYLIPDSRLLVSPRAAHIVRYQKFNDVTLLLDEMDQIYSPKSKDDKHAMTSVLNASFSRGELVPRFDSDLEKPPTEHEPYGAIALGGIGIGWPEMILQRSIMIKLEKRSTSEAEDMPSFDSRDDTHQEQQKAWHERLDKWKSYIPERYENAYRRTVESIMQADDLSPEECSRRKLTAQDQREKHRVYPFKEPYQKVRQNIMTGVRDRKSKRWEALAAVADEAGGHWPDRVRQALQVLEGILVDEQEESREKRMLRNVWDILNGDITGRMFNSDIAQELNEDDYWSNWNNGKGVSASNITKLLKTYSVKPTQMRLGGVTGKMGLDVDTLRPAVERYLGTSTGLRSVEA